MRRVSRLASLSRSAAGAVHGANSNVNSTAAQHQLIQTSSYGTTTTSSSKAVVDQLGPFTRSAANGVAGIVFFSAAASPAMQEVYAKEAPPKVKFDEVVLYQYEACPFCNKVKAFLDYYDIPYKIVEVNPISKKELKWSEDYKKVPILQVDGEKLVDSSAIIDQLFQKIHPSDSLDGEEEKQWRGWVDNHLVHVLSPNIYRNASEALESFDYITTNGNFSFTERLVAKYAGATAMYFVSKKLKKKYNITDERAALYDAANTWVDALKGREFLGGTKPNLADLAVFGVLRPIRYLKSGKDMVENTKIGDWYARMEDAVRVPCGIKSEITAKSEITKEIPQH